MKLIEHLLKSFWYIRVHSSNIFLTWNHARLKPLRIYEKEEKTIACTLQMNNIKVTVNKYDLSEMINPKELP